MENGFGAKLQRGNGATPEVFTDIAEISNIDPSLKRDEIEGTHHGSPGGWKEFKPGLKEGEIAFEGNYLPDDASHDASAGLLKAFNDGLIENYKLVFPVGGVTWSFTAWLREFNPAAPVDDKLGLSGTFRITGQPALA